MDLTFILTTAGLNALVNAANTGSNAIVVDRIGLSASVLPGDPEDNVGLVALPAEIKRLATFGGDVVGDDTIHVTIRDESPDVYELRTFGLYSAGGVLLAFYTQPLPIMEKAASSMLLLAADLKFTTPISAELVFGDTTFINPPATSETAGVVELATAAETATGTDASRAVTPFGLKSLLTSLLAGFSPTGHTHAAADVVFGTFAIARIPDITVAKITDFAAAMTAKADAVHTHAMTSIIGLADALAGKAAAAHTHIIGDITGLTAALGLKLAISDFSWGSLPGRPNVAINNENAGFVDLTASGTTRLAGYTGIGTTNPLGRLHLVGGVKATLTLDRAGSPAARRFQLFVGDGTAGSIADEAYICAVNTDLHFVGGGSGDTEFMRIGFTGAITMAQRPTFAGNAPWDSGNFNPADKANAIHSHDWAQITGKPNVAIQNAVAVFTDIGAVAAGAFSPQGVLRLGDQTGGTRMLHYDGAVYNLPGAPLILNGHQVWTAGNFTPADKANLESPTFTGAPAAPTPAAGTNSTTLATTAFVTRDFQKKVTISTAEPSGGAAGDIWFVVNP
ncbi:MAG: hypothetical protein ACK4JY_07695 [Brevundimonas sp.]|uniref:hypothetical protein n=1 Tax=Brevundimonas sp. TaxID=1871086 RepID=UPI00391B47BF